MPLGRTQTQIIEKLHEMGKLTLEQRVILLARPDEPTGDQLDQILQADHRITLFQLLLAKCRALGLAPFNVARYKMNNGTFEKIDLEFCQRNIILPVGQVGDFLLVAFANPFETSVATCLLYTSDAADD
jgi:type IV pilus assembly protein PilB